MLVRGRAHLHGWSEAYSVRRGRPPLRVRGREADLRETRWAVRLFALASATLGGVVWGPSALATEPADRTADLPDSWLVLYNANSQDSSRWASWYQRRRNIPATHLLGLSADLDEHLPDIAAAQAQIIGPVRDLLDNDPVLRDSVMGILLGYGLPGNYAQPPQSPSIGGYSVADALQDMYDDDKPLGVLEYQGGQWGYNYQCPVFVGRILPEPGRPTKAWLTPDRYMTARIDAPSLEEAKDLTKRAEQLADAAYSLFGETVAYDFYDPDFPTAYHEWSPLRDAVEHPELADLPWAQFEFDDGQVPTGAAFRMAIYRPVGWSAAQFDCPQPGSRVLAFDHNSWGAVTLRSTTEPAGYFCPNALAAGYAAAVGQTGEPGIAHSPYPAVLLAVLREGWTLGEAYYLANPFNDWMWTLVGDPFLSLPHWLDEVVYASGDVNGDGKINPRDHVGFEACLCGPDGNHDSVCDAFDFDGDGDSDLADFAAFQRVYTGGEVTLANGDFDYDGEITLEDVAGYTSCGTAPGPTTLPGPCRVFDFDFDLDADLQDFGRLQVAFGQTLLNPHSPSITGVTVRPQPPSPSPGTHP